MIASQKKKSVLVVDDHPIVRKGLHLLISNDPELSVCGEAESAAEAISLLTQLTPDVLLTDISLSGASGIELIKEVRQINPNIPILVFSIHGEDIYAERVLNAGANGYVMKQEDPDILLKALHKVLTGEIFLSADMTSRMLSQMSGNHSPRREAVSIGIGKLTDRELEVFELIGQGLSTRRIAEKLHLSIKTIETYRLHIKEKFDLHDTAELMHQAVHWVEVDEHPEQ